MEQPHDPHRQGHEQFCREVFPQELEYVRRRRRAVYERRRQQDILSTRENHLIEGQGEALEDPQAPAVPTAKNNLVGLAFSGGGIRSATLNLGIAQALHRRGVLDHVDYLSTVSGGGYLGSSLSTIMRDGAEFPYEQSDGPRESPYLTWLRNHSNYLTPRGFLDYARMIAVLLRGILINFLVVVPVLLVLSLALTGWSTYLEESFFAKGGDWSDTFIATRIAAVLALIYIFTFPVVIWVFKILGRDPNRAPGAESTVKLRDRFERSFSGVILVVVGIAVIEALPILLYYFHEARDEKVLRGVVASVAGGSSIVALTVAGRLMAYFKGVVRTLVMWGVGLLGLLLPLTLILYVAEGLIWGWQGVSLFAHLVPAVFIGLTLGGLLAAGVARLLRHAAKIVRFLAVTTGSVVGFVASLVVVPLVLGPNLLPETYIGIVAGTIGLFTWLSVDVNLTSVHGFYRDRLASAYLVGVDQDTRKGAGLEEIILKQIDIEEDLNLQDICQGGREGETPSIAPYHIVNVAHNLQGSRDPGIRERKSDFFMFSKYFYGGSRTGYCSTDTLEAVSPEMDLSTAMAISAAAAAPNMGGGTVGTLVMLMTLLNIRLGYWIPNPRHLGRWAEKQEQPVESTLWRRYRWRIRPTAFLQEMISSLNETSRWINLSDGGHIENLATYELLRRRCKYIVCGDGEADPNIHFPSLAKLKRFARIDLARISHQRT